ncbi:MAG: uracil-DNA glycosylase [Pseudomonadota bacterium]|nr:uracil-DNA glycosylase [Pseudomonadota bacterium]
MGGTDLIKAEIDRSRAAQALDWWLLSGVDVAVGENPRDWRRAAAPVAPTPPAVAAIASAAPSDLTAFRAWLEVEPGLPLDRAGAKRVLPHGAEAAPLMLMADFPSVQESAEGRPLAGESWVLAQRMLAAIGISPDAAYLATLACFHAPGARLDGSELERCAQIARDHIRLARPERLLLFGDAPARALTGQPLASARGKVHRIEGVRSVATFHPRWLLQRPSDKALAWKDLLLLMSEEG